jgi:hypothetical protein
MQQKTFDDLCRHIPVDKIFVMSAVRDNEWCNWLCDTNPAVMITRLFGIVVLAFSVAEVSSAVFYSF